MPNNIYHKRNANPGVVPTAAQLTVGEIALNTADGKAYTRTTAGTVVELTEASVADGGEQFTPLNISNLALWLDSSDVNSLYTTDAGPVTPVNSPLDVAGCALWLDASDATSITLNGNTVSEWRDLSGNDRHFSQATPAAQPNAVNRTQNGRRVLDFDGTQELLGNAASLNILRNVGGATIMAALKFDALSTLSNGHTAVIITTGTNAIQARAALASVPPVLNSLSAAGRRLDANSFARADITVSVDQDHIATAVFDYANSDASIYRNGSLGGQNLSFQTNGNTSDTDSLSVAVGSGNGTNFLNGWIGEVIVWPRGLTATERARAEAYLAAKWGISQVHTQATATNDPVGAWRDKSGNNRHATQSQAANRPLRGTINGRAAIAFTGANSHALTTTLADAFGDSIGPYTIFGVANNTLGANDRALIGAITTGNFDTALYYNSLNTNTPVVNFYHVGGFRTHTSPVVAANPAVFSFAIQRHSSTAANTTISLWQNGVRPHTLSSLGTYSLGSLRKFLETIGATRTSAGAVSNAMTGNFCELVVYPQALTEAQIIALSQYANTKWGATFATFPRVSNAEAQDWINRVYTNNGTVSVSTAYAVNAFCNAIDAAGIRDRFYRLNLFCGDNLNACLTPLYRGPSLSGTQFGNATDTNNNFLSTDYNERGSVGGLRGNGSSKYLSTGLPMTFLGSNLVHMFASYVGAAEGFTILMGARSNLAGSLTLEAVYAPTSGSNRARAAIFSPGYQASNNASPLTGRTQLLAQCSNGTNQQHFVRNVDLGAVAGPAGAYSATNTTPFYIFAGDSGTSSSNISSYSPHRIDSYSIGAAFTTAAGRTAFHDALTAFQNTLQRVQ